MFALKNSRLATYSRFIVANPSLFLGAAIYVDVAVLHTIKSLKRGYNLQKYRNKRRK